MSFFDDLKKWFTKENSIVTVLILLTIMIFYINTKINNIDYKLQQTLMYSDNEKYKQTAFFYG